MKNKKYIIVGVDPGITTGLCAIDLDGKILKLYSSKKMGFEKIVGWINEVGVPIVIACDVEVPPQLIKKLSMQLKTKIYHPPHDLKVGEKQRITEDIPTKDDHQRDACAAALFAFKKYQSLFKKVDSFLKKIGKEEKGDEVKKKLLFREAKNIKDALKEKVEEVNLQKKKRVKHLEKENEATVLRKEITYLRNKLDEIKTELKKEKGKNRELREKLSLKKSNKELLQLADKRKSVISSLEEKILKMKIEISKLREELQRKNEEERILKKYDCYIIREINNLSEKEAEKIKDEFGDVILVKNLTLPSKSVAHLLKKQHINIIIYEKGKKLADKLTKDGFTLINSKAITIQVIANNTNAPRQ